MLQGKYYLNFYIRRQLWNRSPFVSNSTSVMILNVWIKFDLTLHTVHPVKQQEMSMDITLGF